MPNGGICLHVVFPDQGLFMKPLSGDFFTQGGAKHAKIFKGISFAPWYLCVNYI